MNLNVDEKEKQNLKFQGKRNDRNLVNELTGENGAIFKPKQRAISKAIANLGQNGSSDNINFLFSVVENLNYGVKKDSELSDFLDNKSNVTNVVKKQNNDWETQLKSALNSAISKNKTRDAGEFKEKFDALFPPEKEDDNVMAKPVVNLPVVTKLEQQKELIKLRTDILNSDSVKNAPESFGGKQKDEFTSDKRKLNKNLDYFIASSEVSNGEKIECLKILKHMSSPDYKINPQLKDYKAKILNEIVEDIVVEEPNRKKLISKAVAQRTHGMCAAISISRKALPQEHKLAFVSTIASELDDKSDMEVYDVTSPKLTKKIRVKKADIDYNQALREEYRVTDAAVTNWMNVADTYGDGSRQFKWFKPFDEEHYDMFRDGHFANDLEGEKKQKQYTLRALIKINEKGNSIAKIRGDYNKAVLDRKVVDNNYIEASKIVYNNMEDILIELPNVSKEQSKEMSAKLLNDSYLNKIGKPFIHQYTDEESLQNAKDILKSEFNIKNSSKLDKVAKGYLDNYAALKTAKVDKINNKMKLNKYSTANLQTIFDYAAFTRVKTEFELDIPEKLEEKAKLYGINPKDDPKEVKAKILKKMENHGQIMKRKDLDEIKDRIYTKINLERRSTQLNDMAAQRTADKMVLFTPVQKEMLKKVEENFPKQNKEFKKEYKQYRDELAPDLEKQYGDFKLGGALWALEDGQSGLGLPQQIRLIEQLSGKEHYSEKNASKAMDNIEQAKGGSILSSSVCDNDAGFHAQYIYDVKHKYAKNNETEKPEDQRVLYTDNSWGSSEKRISNNPEIGRTYWKDSEGNLRTDYGRNIGGEFGDKGGFGYKYGFLLDDNYTIGVNEDELNAGQVKMKHKIGNKETDVSIPLLSSMILRGNGSSVADYEALSMQDLLFGVISQRTIKEVTALSDIIRNGNNVNIVNFSNDLKNTLLPKIPEYVNKSDDELAKSLHKDINGLISKYPEEMFKPEDNSKISRPDKFEDKLVSSLSSAIKETKQSSDDKVLVQCAAASKFDKVLDKEVQDGTTLRLKPRFNTLETVKETYNKEYKDVISKLQEDKPDSINTKPKFDALPENDKLKMTVKRAALFEQMYNIELSSLTSNSRLMDAAGASNVDYGSKSDEDKHVSQTPKIKGLSMNDIRGVADKIIFAKDNEDISNISGDFKKLKEDQILLGINKSVLQEINKVPKNIDELKSIPSGESVINYIDTKYNPQDDDKLMKIYNKLLEMPKEEQEKLVRSSSDAQVGNEKPNYYQFLQRVHGFQEGAENSIQSVIMYDILAKEYGLKAPFKEGLSKQDQLLISLTNAMSYAEAGNMIKQIKHMAINDMHAYPALPTITAIPEKEINADNKDMLHQLTDVVDKINGYKKIEGFTNAEEAKTANEEIKIEKKTLRDKTKIIANACIQPSHVDYVMAKMNNYYAERGNNPDSQTTKDAEEDLLKTMSEYHISRKPQEMFKSYIKDLSDENNYGSDDIRDNIIQVKSVFLTRACNASDKEKFELQMMLATQNGKMSSIARDLKDPRFGIAQVGQKDALPWNDPKALNLLIEQLKDENNDNETLKHFLLTTGMVSDAVDAFVKGPAPSKHLLRVTRMKGILDTYVADQKVISDKHDNFISNLSDSQKSTKNIDEVKEITNDYLKSVLPEGRLKDGSAAAEYREMVEDRLNFNDVMGVRDTASEFLNSVHNEFVKSEDDAKEDTIEKIIMHQNILGKKISNLQVIASLLKPGDPQKVEAENYVKDATDTVQQMEKIKDVFQQEILDKIDQKAAAEKANKLRKQKTIDSINGITGAKPFDKEKTNSEKQKAEADSMYNNFLDVQRTNDETSIKITAYGILNSDNPEITKHLVDNMNDENASPLSRAYAVRCLIEKKDFGALKDYAAPRLMSDDPSKLDDTTINCVDGLIVAAIIKPEEEKKPYLDLVSRALNIACDKDYKSDKAYSMMSGLRNSLANKSPEINNMLLKNVFDKNMDENTRAISMDILSRSGSGEFKPLLEDVIVNTDKYADNPSEAFTFFDVALLGLKNIKMATVNTESNIKDYLKNLDVKKIVDSGFEGQTSNDANAEEAKAAKEADFKQRIDFILKDKDNDEKDKDNDETMLNTKPIEMTDKIDNPIACMAYSSISGWKK